MTAQSIDSIRLRLTQLADNSERFIEPINTAKDEHLLDIDLSPELVPLG